MPYKHILDEVKVEVPIQQDSEEFLLHYSFLATNRKGEKITLSRFTFNSFNYQRELMDITLAQAEGKLVRVQYMIPSISSDSPKVLTAAPILLENILTNNL